jgi:hypothetical protein
MSLHICLIHSTCAIGDCQLLNIKFSDSYYNCSLLDHMMRSLIVILMIYLLNCSWVATRWQQYSTHLHTNKTQNDTKQTVHILTPWCRVLLEQLTNLQLVKKFPSFYGTRRFITTLTKVRHLSISWASAIQSIYPHPTSWRSALILSTHVSPGFPIGLFLLRFGHQEYVLHNSFK